MNEVKTPKKPLIFYYVMVFLLLMMLNFMAIPWMAERQVREVDYGTFMTMTEDKKIAKVEIDESEIVFTDKDGNTVATVTFNADGTVDVTYPDPTTKVKVVEPVTADPNGKDIVKIVLPNDDNEYTVSATDKAGNSTTPVKVVEKSIDTFIDEIESELPKNPETGKPDTSLFSEY